MLRLAHYFIYLLFSQKSERIKNSFLFFFPLHVFQSLSHVQLFAAPWTAACQSSLSFIVSQSLLKFTSTESVMPSNHLILCHPLLL